MPQYNSIKIYTIINNSIKIILLIVKMRPVSITYHLLSSAKIKKQISDTKPVLAERREIAYLSFLAKLDLSL